MASQIPRRSVLAVLGLGAGAVLAGCQDGTEGADPTARPGPSRSETSGSPAPTPDHPPDSELLAAALTRARELSVRCSAITGAASWRVEAQERTQAALDTQVEVLERLLEAGEVPLPAPPEDALATAVPGDGTDGTAGPGDAEATTAPGDGDSTTADPGEDDEEGDAEEPETPAVRAARQLEELAQACRDDVSAEALEQLGTLSEENLPVLVSLAAQRGATALTFHSRPQWGPLDGPAGEPAAALLEVYRPAVYAFGVLAARSREDERTAYQDALRPLREVTRLLTQLAGDSAPPAPLGYALPEGTWDQEGRQQLATDLLAAVPPAITGQSPGLTGDPAGIAGAVRLLAEVLHLGRSWISMPGFPGMDVPGD